METVPDAPPAAAPLHGRPETQARILAAALALLEEAPTKPPSMSAIARRAGVSRQALYLHFETRAQLLVEAARRLDEIKGSDARLAPSRAATDGRRRLREFIAAWGGFIPEIHGVARAFLAMRAEDPDAAAAWEDRMAALRHGCAAAVAALKADGALAEGLAEEAATDLLWALLSVGNWEMLTTERGWSQEAYVAGMQRAAEAMLTCAPEAGGGAGDGGG
ncbi:TetR/AcrR family transcriptional regulator [Rhodovulum sp. DZ06]|uniref:TetR/AcrR family transcriptional regulator n=1 Tax=Rhodovulum sp. DZ06 TaxID=3425126 RepID=UPI003D342A65